MKKFILCLSIYGLFSHAVPAHALYPITEWMSFAEKTVQDATDSLAEIDFQNAINVRKEEEKQSDPNANGRLPVNEMKGSTPSSEFPPYVGPDLQRELSKESPSIPTVEVLVRDVLVYKSDTIEKKGDLTERTAEGKNVKVEKSDDIKNSLENMFSQTLIVYTNGRSLARRVLDLRDKSDDDANQAAAEQSGRTTTGEQHKNITNVIFKTHMLLNEIATLRNSYLEIISIDAMQAKEAPKESSLLDSAADIAGKMIGKK